MTARAVIGVLVAFCGLWPCQANQCQQPESGKCFSDKTAIDRHEVCCIQAASCAITDTSGLCAYRQGCADPHMSNWTRVGGHARAQQNGSGVCGHAFYYSVLESPRLNISQASCLTVAYRRKNPAALDVFLELDAGEVLTLLNRSDDAEHDVRDDFTTNVNPGIGKIIFRAYGGGGGTDSYVAIYKVTMKTGMCSGSGEYEDSTDECVPFPIPTTSTLTSTSPSLSSPPSSSSSSSSVDTSATRPTQTSSTEDPFMGKGGDSPGAVIGGTVAAVIVIIIVVVIIGVYLYRRRRARKPEERNITVHSPVPLNGCQEPRQASNDYLEILDSHDRHHGYVNDYTGLDCAASASHVTRHHDDVSPYEVADDGSSRKRPALKGSGQDQVKGSQNATAEDQSLNVAEGEYSDISDPPTSLRLASDGDGAYSCIGDAPQFPRHQDSGANDGYSHIGDSRNAPKSGERGTGDAYSNIGDSQNPPRHGEAGVSDDYSHIKNSNRSTQNQVESVSDDYNHIDSSRTAPQGQKGKADAHNHTSHTQSSRPAGTRGLGNNAAHNPSPSHLAKPHKFPTVTPSTDGDSGQYSLQKPIPEAVGDYNTLHFDERGEESAENRKKGATNKAYDHVLGDPDGDYSQTGTGKRNVVIDSDYDHLKP